MEGAVILARFLPFITIHLLKHIKFLQGTRKWKINNFVCCLLTERNEEKAECVWLYFPCVVLIVINSNWAIGRQKINIIRRRWGQTHNGAGAQQCSGNGPQSWSLWEASTSATTDMGTNCKDLGTKDIGTICAESSSKMFSCFHFPGLTGKLLNPIIDCCQCCLELDTKFEVSQSVGWLGKILKA